MLDKDKCIGECIKTYEGQIQDKFRRLQIKYFEFFSIILLLQSVLLFSADKLYFHKKNLEKKITKKYIF